ncbi:RebB family R body protein [Moorena sp. SIO4G3]|uniref:RebB family R body protein n=1 Tax=Moorena sp. SIO4G3 TaxID=2607821 RepID=UPI00142B67B8|nr:RebB family R body protein [Moorena sp. SIO4G3]NEO78751.1 RebB like protein [Moorena sp. SIO4G3]
MSGESENSTGSDQVNSQITDSVTQINTSVLAIAPAQSMGLVYQTMAHSISLTMQNAVTHQNAMQQINTSIISTACQRIMSLGK